MAASRTEYLGADGLVVGVGTRAALLALLLTALVLGGVPAPALAAGLAPSGRGPLPAAVSPAAVSFAERAGFSGKYLELAHAQHPARGTLDVVVVFSLRTSSGDPSVATATGPPLSVREFAQRFGLAPSSLAAAESYFESYGIRVRSVSVDHLSLSLAGSASDLGRAFGTTLEAGTNGSRPVVFPARPPTLPPSLEDEVAGVVGLSSGFDTFSFSLSSAAAGPSAVAPSTITPARARSIYDLSGLYNLTGGPTNATGHDIAVVLWGKGYSPSDLATFWAKYYPSTFPVPTVVPYPVDGAPKPNTSAPLGPDALPVDELTLDIEWSASMAPGATIDAVYTQEGTTYPNYSPSAADLTTALETALGLRSSRNLTAISMSFGSSESSDASLIAAWTPLFAEAKQLGVTLLGATGDQGGDTTACSGTPDPQFPASSPDVLAVGGTAVTLTNPLLGGGFTESAWSKSGGGFSGTFAAPAWQKVGSAAAPISANGHRGMPDVSATASNDFVYFNGTSSSEGGTSFATPLWAGLVTMIDAKWGHPLGFFTDRLYHEVANQTSAGVGIADVTSGANCVASAGPGWDAATGWGSPRAAALYAELVGSFVHLTLSVFPSPVAPGGSVTVSARLTNLSSGQPIPGQAVRLALTSELPAGPCSGSFGVVTPTTDANGTVVARFSVPFCYLGTHARVQASVTTVRYFGSASAALSVNLIGWFPQLGFLASSPWKYVTFAAITAAAVALGGWLGRRRRPTSRQLAPYPPATPPNAPPPPGPPMAPLAPPSPPQDASLEGLPPAVPGEESPPATPSGKEAVGQEPENAGEPAGPREPPLETEAEDEISAPKATEGSEEPTSSFSPSSSGDPPTSRRAPAAKGSEAANPEATTSEGQNP